MTLRKTLTEYCNTAYQSKKIGKTFCQGRQERPRPIWETLLEKQQELYISVNAKVEKKVTCLSLAMFGNKFWMHAALFITLNVHREKKCALYSDIGKYFGLLLLFPKSTTRLPILFYSYFSKSQGMLAFRNRHNRKGKQYSLDLLKL